MVSDLMGIKVVTSEQALGPAFDLLNSTKEFVSDEFYRKFVDWSVSVYGKEPCIYMFGDGLQNALIVHPSLVPELKRAFESRSSDAIDFRFMKGGT